MTHFEEIISAANILVEQKKFSEAIPLYLEAVENTDTAEYKIDLFNTIARIYLAMQKEDEALLYFEQSLDIHQNLPDNKAQKLLTNKAVVLNNLGAITVKNNPVKAVDLHREALDIFKTAEEDMPGKYTLHLTNTLYSYGDAAYAKKDFYLAKKQFREALKRYEEFEDTPANQSVIARIYYNLGNIFQDEHNVYDARSNYLKALKIYKNLSAGNPLAFEPLLAATYNNLGVTAKTMYRFSDALTYYEHALKLYENLIEKDREYFLPYYAATLNSIGIIYTEQHEVKDDISDLGLTGFSGFGILSPDNLTDTKKDQKKALSKEKAIEYYQHAIRVYNELADKSPETYTHYLATSLHNLGVLYDENKSFEEAENYYTKALKIRRYLASNHPGIFNLDTSATLLNLITMYQFKMEQSSDIRYKSEALSLLEEVAERLKDVEHSDKPVIQSMLSEMNYFKKYFGEVDEAYLEISGVIFQTESIEEKIKETLVPAEKLKHQQQVINLLYSAYKKHSNDKRIQKQLLSAYSVYSWLALRSNMIAIAEKALSNGLKLNPESLELKANLAHLHLLKNEMEKAVEIYKTLKDLHNDENESFINVLKTDLAILKSDGVFTGDVQELLENITR